MLGGETGTVAVATLVGGQLLALTAAYWFGRGALSDRGERDPVGAEGDCVVCPACGTENECGYRYCRRCVETLATGGQRGPGEAGAPSPADSESAAQSMSTRLLSGTSLCWTSGLV
jgi:hypothetical protein